MGKTYRKVPDEFLDYDEVPERKIKRKDKKHSTVILNDGGYTSQVDNDFSDEELTRRQKAVIKNHTIKKSRVRNKEIEED